MRTMGSLEITSVRTGYLHASTVVYISLLCIPEYQAISYSQQHAFRDVDNVCIDAPRSIREGVPTESEC